MASTSLFRIFLMSARARRLAGRWWTPGLLLTAIVSTVKARVPNDHRSAFLELPALVLGTRSQLQCIPMLIEARETPPTPGGARSISSRAACVTKIATSGGPKSIANRTPRIVSHAGFPTDERLILTLSGTVTYMRTSFLLDSLSDGSAR